MRHREKVTGGFDRLAVYRAYEVPSTSPYYTAEEFVGTKKTKVIEDVQIPHFQKLRACGAFLPLNPVLISTVIEERRPGAGGFHLYNDDGSVSRYSEGELYLDWTGTLTPPALDSALAEDAVTRAAADAADATWDTLTFLAEAHESYEMVVGAVHTLYDRFVFRAAERAIRDGRKVSILKRFSDAWLSYRYGWMPLMYDIEDAAKALSSKKRKFDIKKGRGHNETNWTDTDTHVVNTGTESWHYRHTLTVVTSYRGKAYTRILDPTKNTYGFNIAATAWEVVPYSFVVDWFINVGNWIKSMTPAAAGSEFLGAQSAIKQTITSVQTVDIVWDVLPHTDGSVSGMRKQIVSEIYRRNPTGIPSVPHVNVRLNAVRWTDLFALVAGNNRRLARMLGF